MRFFDLLQRNRATTRTSLLVSFVLVAAPVSSLDVDLDANASRTSGVLAAALEELEDTVRSLEANLEAQEKAWPTRERDQANELPTPPAVKQLQAKRRLIEGKQKRLLKQLGELGAADPEQLLGVLGKLRDQALVDLVVPTVARVARTDRRLVGTLRNLARRFTPCPASVVSALADLRDREASLLLLELGIQEQSVRLITAAGQNGDPVVLDQLIALADERTAFARDCQRAVGQLTPPAHRRPGLAQLIISRIETVRSRELKTSLIVYLGLIRDASSFDLLKSIFETHRDERVRLAAVGALGNVGTVAAGEFLVNQLEERERKGLTLALEKSCVHALGAAGFRPAAPVLIDLLADRGLNRLAARALTRIAGRNHGNSKGVWLRWWRTQDEALGERDPEE